MEKLKTALVKCPATGKLLEIGVVMPEESFKRSTFTNGTVMCPFCETGHIFNTKDIILADARDSKPPDFLPPR